MLVEELDLSVRTYNCLKRANINSVEDLITIIDEGLETISKIRNLGIKGLDEILYKLSSYGFKEVDQSITKYIEKLRGEGIETGQWELTREMCKERFLQAEISLHSGTKISRLEGVPYPLKKYLHSLNIVTVEDLLDNYTSVDELDIRLDYKCVLLKVLDRKGYRMKDCSIEQYPDIGHYIKLKQAEEISIKDLKITAEIVEILERVNITKVSQLITKDSHVLSNYLNPRQISVLLRCLDSHCSQTFRTADFAWEEYPEIENALAQFYPIPIIEMGFSTRIRNSLGKNGIFVLSDLQAMTRKELLERKIVGTSALEEVIGTLQANLTHLKGETFYTCSRCEREFIGFEDQRDNHYCNCCLAKMKRIQNVKNYVVTLTGPDYSSYTDGSEGFTLFATIHNKTNEIVEVQLKEFKIFADNRQWVPSTNLSGYGFRKGHLLPETSQTIGKVWSEHFWKNRMLEKGDYVIFSVEIKQKIYMFKFLRKTGEWELDDYYTHKV